MDPKIDVEAFTLRLTFGSYFGFGFKWFPLENVGINLNYSRNRYNLFLTEQTFGSNQTDLSDYEYQLDVKGGEIALGLSLKF